MAPFKNSSRVYLLYSPHYSGCLQFLCFSSSKPRTAWLYPQPSRSSSSSSEKKKCKLFSSQRSEMSQQASSWPRQVESLRTVVGRPGGEVSRWSRSKFWAERRRRSRARGRNTWWHPGWTDWEAASGWSSGWTDKSGNTKYQLKFPELQARLLSELFSFYSWDCIKEEGRMR